MATAVIDHAVLLPTVHTLHSVLKLLKVQLILCYCISQGM